MSAPSSPVAAAAAAPMRTASSPPPASPSRKRPASPTPTISPVASVSPSAAAAADEADVRSDAEERPSKRPKFDRARVYTLHRSDFLWEELQELRAHLPPSLAFRRRLGTVFYMRLVGDDVDERMEYATEPAFTEVFFEMDASEHGYHAMRAMLVARAD